MGHGVTLDDFVLTPLAEFEARLRIFSKYRLSMTARILTLNMFLYPLFSYVARVFVMRTDAISGIASLSLGFLTRMPLC